MNCTELTNDLLLAPTVDASDHLAACAECRDRQKVVALTARALRALGDDTELPERNDSTVRAAIAGIARDAARRRPAGWGSVAAAAALLLAAGIGGFKYATRRVDPAAGSETVASQPAPVPPSVAPKGLPGAEPVIPGGPTDVRPPDNGGTAKPPDPEPEPPSEPLPQPPPGEGFLAGGELPPIPAEGRIARPPDVPPQPEEKLLTSGDCLAIMKGVVGATAPAALDLNGDGECNVADALIAARAVTESGGRQ
ncbi:MAG: hypothetical protein HYY18_01820 [Planctomycetes bacterium]|nr:hypothetical protein [Planctomycetota bacterium]